MKVEQCEKCPHLTGEVCGRKGKPISKIKGCSLYPSGKKFFRSRGGKEAYRLNVLGKHKGDNK
jgi:hypothetical protein